METRLALAVVILVIAVVVARYLEGRRPQAPTQGTWEVPSQLDRADFPGSGEPVLVVLFSSATCDNCAVMAERVGALAEPGVATCEIEVGREPDLHRRYKIEAVPIVVVADAEGVARGGFVGATPALDLVEAVRAAQGS